MAEQLSTPLTHRLIASSVGLLFQSRLFERLKIATRDGRAPRRGMDALVERRP